MRAFNYISADWIPIGFFLKETEWFQADSLVVDNNRIADIYSNSVKDSFQVNPSRDYIEDLKKLCLPADPQTTQYFDWALLPSNRTRNNALLLMESGYFRVVPKNLLVQSINRAKWSFNFREISSPNDSFPKKLKFIKILNCTTPTIVTAHTLFLKVYTAELLKTLEEMNIPPLDLDPRFLNWLNGYPLRSSQALDKESVNQLSADSELAKTRLQAFAAYPLLALIYCSSEIEWDKKQRYFKELIINRA